MPRFRATSARLEFARRLAVTKLCQHFRYEWTQADQAIFDFALSRTMRNEPWQSSRDIATYIFGFFYYLQGETVRPHVVCDELGQFAGLE